MCSFQLPGPRSQKMRITSRSDKSRLRHGSKDDVDGATTTTVQKERQSYAPSTSSLSSIDGLLVFQMISPHRSKCVDSCLLDDVSPLCSPQPQRKQLSGLHGPTQGRGTDSGPLVWVRVTKSGPATDDHDSSGESYWWPACVRQTDVLSPLLSGSDILRRLWKGG